MDFSGNAGNTTVVIIVIFLSGLIMFVAPLVIIASQQDKVAQLQAQEIVTEFSDTVRTKKGMTQEDYDNLVLSLAATGRSYKIDLTVQLGDGNPAKKLATVQIGDDVYYIMYTTQVLESLPLELNNGDFIYVSCEPTDVSIFTQLVNSIFKTQGTAKGKVSAGGMV